MPLGGIKATPASALPTECTPLALVGDLGKRRKSEAYEKDHGNCGSGGGSRPADGLQRDTHGDNQQPVRTTR